MKAHREEFFHIAPLPLEAGSIILPGNWGRIIRHHGEAHNCARREIELKAVRAAEFPDKPSRWTATFSFYSEVVARHFWRTRPTDILYRVEQVNPEAAQHVGNLNAVDPIKNRGESWSTGAKRYWSCGTPILLSEGLAEHPMEVVLASALRIIGPIS